MKDIFEYIWLVFLAIALLIATPAILVLIVPCLIVLFLLVLIKFLITPVNQMNITVKKPEDDEPDEQ